MTVYVFGGTKGGVGKSTHACNCAAALAIEGRKVCIVDMDIQAHATEFVSLRSSNGYKVPRIECGQAVCNPQDQNSVRKLGPLLDSFVRQYEDVVIDAGGRNSPELRAALRKADIAVIPFKAKLFDLFTVEDMAEVLGLTREYNPKLRALAFINEASNNWVSQQAARAARTLDKVADTMRRAETLIHLRESYALSLEDGRAVMELGASGAKAADEWASLFAEVQLVLKESR